MADHDEDLEPNAGEAQPRCDDYQWLRGTHHLTVLLLVAERGHMDIELLGERAPASLLTHGLKRLIDTLEQAGLVVVRRHSANSRPLRLHLTPLGRVVADRIVHDARG